MAARMACWRKSGVVSMTTLWPLRDSRMEGRRRLSCGSFEWQTRHGQPKVGTPIEVPEPSTVILNGVCGILLIQIGGRGHQVGGHGHGLCRLDEESGDQREIRKPRLKIGMRGVLVILVP